jgi:hypothetical protein
MFRDTLAAKETVTSRAPANRLPVRMRHATLLY